MAHGLNANLVHKWRRCERSKVVASVTPPPAQTFIPVVIAPPVVRPPICVEPRKLRIELRRGGVVAMVNWPMSATTECAGWLRELLR